MRTFSEIAREIRAVWVKESYAATPYIDAMMCINSSDPNHSYGFDNAKGIVLYFLANASTFRGADARRIKEELKSMIK